MCLKFDVKLTETLSDQLAKAGETNSRLLIQLAEAAQRQGDYQLAAKKFTQAGEKVIIRKIQIIFRKYIYSITIFLGFGDESATQIWRYRAHHFLRECFPPSQHLRSGGKLSADVRLALSSGIREKYRRFLHQS